MVKVTFRFEDKGKAGPGESVGLLVSGHVEAMWTPSVMTKDGDTWNLEMDLPVDVELEYKHVILTKDNTSLSWEGEPKSFKMAKTVASHETKDCWEEQKTHDDKKEKEKEKEKEPTSPKAEKPPSKVAEKVKNVVHTGHLTKCGARVKNWKRRFFIMNDVELAYYVDPNKINSCKGRIPINTIRCVRMGLLKGKKVGQRGFMVVTPKRTYSMFADDEAQTNLWMDKFREIKIQVENAWMSNAGGAAATSPAPASPPLSPATATATATLASPLSAVPHVDISEVDKAFNANPIAFLTTHDDHSLSSRPMYMRRNDTLGYHMLTHKKTKKVAHINSNPNVVLLWGKTDIASTQYVETAATIRVADDEQTRTQAWRSEYSTWYSGPNDPQLTVLLVTINHVKMTAVKVANMDAVDAAVAESNVAQMVTHVGQHLSCRPMMILKHPELGYHFITRVGTNKLQHIAANPNGNLLLGKVGVGARKYVDAQVQYSATTDAAVAKQIWKDDFKMFGYTGVDDPKLVVVLIQFLLVRPTIITPTVDMEVVDEVYAQSEFVTLTTHSAEGRLSSRPMWLRKHAELGYHVCTHAQSRKVQQVQADPKVTLLVGKTDTSAKKFVKVTAVAKIAEDVATKQKLWQDDYKQFGFAGAEDPAFTVLLFSVTKTDVTVMPHMDTSTTQSAAPRIANMDDVDKAFGMNEVVALATTASDAPRIRCRPMWLRKDPKLGYHFLTRRDSRKVADIDAFPNCVITLGQIDTSCRFFVELKAKIVKDTSPVTCGAVWRDDYKRFGFSGADDPAFTPLLVEPVAVATSEKANTQEPHDADKQSQ
eukprot:TRINITY_DN963_c2_g1_i1.p1 TRINITY_DN963_c2_g1~~TRINITY_DN963_c2_g1_i1.p1  ORF type:complete len:821 (-),score=190.75 TRINITY_DN963_c2_g1_i1:33-2495(-)